ncbi:kinesin-domain-containing protein, partial [Basidiobolus meristosporus CBS 931.73]
MEVMSPSSILPSRVSRKVQPQSPISNARKSLFTGTSSPGTLVGGKTPYHNRLEKKFNSYDPNREPVKTYLRIRPGPTRNLQTSLPSSYLNLVSDNEVLMAPPTESNAYKVRSGIQERFKFTKVFSEETEQQDFFQETARPLIEQVIEGENALIFAYGVSNSGKTYTIQGSREHPGLLPRSLELILNSIQENQSNDQLRPVRYSEVENFKNHRDFNVTYDESLHSYEKPEQSPDKIACDPDYEYAVWVSYAEIYNEKVYDLLDSSSLADTKRSSLTLKKDRKTGYKYIHGLREFRVNSVEDGYQLLNQGQKNRTVFSTMLNAVSSRSHSIFTIKLIRVPKNAMTEELKIKYSSVSRISLVDLAGAERSKLTQNTGERLKEANNINKSLMVLGQCLVSLRHNQTREHKEVVPFRQSKLTEMFQSSFTGEAKAVMLVNVNPYETSFAETSHVLKFAAVAMDITTVRRTVQKVKVTKLLEMEAQLATPTKPPKRPSFDSDFVSEEDEYESDEEMYIADMVKKYEDILYEIREKWLDAESRCANMETIIREELTNEFASQVKHLESLFSLRLTNESDMNEFKTERKIDIVSRNTMFM